jgi:hypothetical protein
MVAARLQELFQEDERLRKGSYRVAMRIWVAADGRIEKAERVGSAGNSIKDEAIDSLLKKPLSIGQARPIEMPQQINIQLVSRG